MTNATPERIGDQPWAQRVRRWQDLKGVVCPAHGRDHPAARLIPGIPDLLEIGPRLVCGVEVPARHMLASPEGRCRWDAEVPELVVDPQRHRQLFPKCDHAADLYFCECADFDDSHPSTVHERVSPHELVPLAVRRGRDVSLPPRRRRGRGDPRVPAIRPVRQGRRSADSDLSGGARSVHMVPLDRQRPAERLGATRQGGGLPLPRRSTHAGRVADHHAPQNRRKVLNLRLSSRLEAARWCDRQATGDDEPVECDVPDCTIRARDASSRSD